VHLHVTPADDMGEMSFARVRNASATELAATAAR